MICLKKLATLMSRWVASINFSLGSEVEKGRAFTSFTPDDSDFSLKALGLTTAYLPRFLVSSSTLQIVSVPIFSLHVAVVAL